MRGSGAPRLRVHPCGCSVPLWERREGRGPHRRRVRGTRERRAREGRSGVPAFGARRALGGKHRCSSTQIELYGRRRPGGWRAISHQRLPTGVLQNAVPRRSRKATFRAICYCQFRLFSTYKKTVKKPDSFNCFHLRNCIIAREKEKNQPPGLLPVCLSGGKKAL